MEQDPSWETNRFAASQEILHILWNPKAQYRIHKCPPPVPIMSQLDPVHTPTSNLLNISLNIVLPSTPESPMRTLSLRFPHQNYIRLSSPPYVLHTPPNSFVSIITPTILGEQYRTFSSSLGQLQRLQKYFHIAFKLK
jgi:hypothetical protein